MPRVSLKNPPALQQSLSREAAQGISAISRNAHISIPVATFLALINVGVSATQAYLTIRPHVTTESASVLGGMLKRKHKDASAAIDPNLAQAVLADAVAIHAMTAPDASLRDRLTAADQTNRKLQRYADGQVQINVLAALHVPDDEQPAELLPLELPQDVVVDGPDGG